MTPPLVDARIKHTLPFGGSSLLGIILRLAERKERALIIPFSRVRPPTVSDTCILGVLGAVPATLGLCGGWVACRFLQRAVLVAP